MNKREPNLKTKFLRIQLDALNELLTTVVDGELPRQVALYYIYVVSHAWFFDPIRNPCIVSRRNQAEFWNVEIDTISKWSKLLEEMGYLEVKYLVFDNRTRETSFYNTHEEAFTARNNGRGRMMNGKQLFVVDDRIRVGNGIKKRGEPISIEENILAYNENTYRYSEDLDD